MGGSALGGTAAPAVLPSGSTPLPRPSFGEMAAKYGDTFGDPRGDPRLVIDGHRPNRSLFNPAVQQETNMQNQPLRVSDGGSGVWINDSGPDTLMSTPTPSVNAPINPNITIDRPMLGGKGGVGGQPAQPVNPSQPTPMAQTNQPNVYNQSAQAYTQALQGTQAGMQYQPMMVGGQGYNPATTGSTGYNAAQVSAAQLAGTDMSQYMNPFTQNVIDRSLADIGGAQQTAMGQLGAQAQAARAFGGSRQGIAQAETNKGFTKQIADTSANLNLQNYNQAQQAAFQDIAARNQMGLANQNALNQARQFGAGAFNQASQLNQGAYNQAGQFNAGAANQAALANQQASLAAAQQRLGASSQMGGLANTGFNFGQQLGAQQGQQGALQQALNQALIDAGKSQYGGFTGAPNQALTLPLAALGVSNMGQKSTTDSKQLGLLDYLTAAGQIATICWVAREVYGADDPKWLQFREYLLSKAPAWLLKGYIKHGEKFAEVVKRNSWIKAILRPLMDAGRRKVGYK